jgi:hypothetical protein
MAGWQVFGRTTFWRMVAGCSLLSLTVLAGCGDDGPKLGQVTGSVTRKGAPVGNCTIVFHPTDGRPSFGFVDQHGKFKLEYLKGTAGAKVGQHRVYVAFDRSGGPEMELARAAGKLKHEGEQEAILAKYGIEKSQLTIDVKPGPQDLTIQLD